MYKMSISQICLSQIYYTVKRIVQVLSTVYELLYYFDPCKLSTICGHRSTELINNFPRKRILYKIKENCYYVRSDALSLSHDYPVKVLWSNIASPFTHGHVDGTKLWKHELFSNVALPNKNMFPWSYTNKAHIRWH